MSELIEEAFKQIQKNCKLKRIPKKFWDEDEQIFGKNVENIPHCLDSLEGDHTVCEARNCRILEDEEVHS